MQTDKHPSRANIITKDIIMSAYGTPASSEILRNISPDATKETKTSTARLALGPGLLALAEMSQQEDAYKGSLALVGSQLEGFIKAQGFLDSMSDVRWSSLSQEQREKTQANKNIACTFNRYCADALNACADRDISFADFNTILTQLYVQMKGPAGMHRAAKMIQATTIGVRNEVGFGVVLDEAGYDWRPSTVEEDRRGADFILLGEHDQPFPSPVGIDVKADPVTAKRAQEKAAANRRDPSRIVYSQIPFDAFEGNLRLSPEAAAAVVPAVTPALNAAVRSYPQNRLRHTA